MPSVSIIIPFHNAQRWLSAAIESALVQTIPDKEIIAVDDGSTDQSLAIACGFADRGVRVAAQSNRGASAARNHGMRVARGDFLQFLDSDDLLAPDKIGRQLDVLKDAPGCVAAGSWGHFRVSPADAVFHPEPVWRNANPADWLIASWTGGGMMHPAAWLTPRAVAASAGPWNESISLDDDGEYFCRVVLRSQGVRFVADARSFYRTHDAPRLSRSGGRKAAESSFLACTLKEQQLRCMNDTNQARRAIAANYSRFAWEQIVAAPDLAEEAVRRWRRLAPEVPPPRGGRLYNVAAAVLGWRRARRLQARLSHSK